MTHRKHADGCMARAALLEETEYLKLYPRVCRNCGGTGQTVIFESHGFGDGIYEEIPDLCGCVESGVCPRCGEDVTMVQGFDSDYFRCSSCHWTDTPGCSPPERAPLIEDDPCTCSLSWQGDARCVDSER